MNDFISDDGAQDTTDGPMAGSVPQTSPGLELAARTLVEERVRALRRLLDRELDPDDIIVRPTAPASRKHLFEDACDLYWNELNWEQLTDEERISGGELTEMVFPGLLTLVDALLPRSDNGEPDRDREHRDVAHDFLLWLAGRLVELRATRPDDEEDRERIRAEIQVTDDLIDLVSCRLYCLTDEETGRIRGFGI
ncbi:MAG: hypothetical protein M8860_00295 [marine benthic group bacterium]|jgi:hypothetical protein|nr:hypothetical protein [Gemmatimonadota bacterium]MCL7961270.1 hypothetical protein [Candidatus Carthagonibacter metallireducens]MCL7937346.1 hypothetical protein [Gemmatimonadota bacterium]MCL7956907.1 hypothetical protein [Gemmatimonadota bacterium]MCL7964109.1 hypothetical protein [Gemmatimonadota bacterium]